MNAQEFAYWLQGFVELHGEMPTPEQWESIKEHLALVFVKVTPAVSPLHPFHHAPIDNSWIEDAVRRGQTVVTC